MCGRYACVIRNLGRWKAVFTMLLETIDDRFNIAPTATVPAFTADGWKKMRWGLVPSWSKEPKTKYSTFNARIETFTEKPLFRSAWKEEQRCLIPVSGYYEWVKEGKNKKPYYICAIDDEPLVFAGLWEKWERNEESLLSCTIITAPSQGKLAELHHRMPVMIEPDQAEKWLQGSKKEAFDIVRKSAKSSGNVRFYQVSEDVGNSRNQGANLIRPCD